MNAILLISNIVLWVSTLFLGFLVLGTLRGVALVNSHWINLKQRLPTV